MFGRRTRVDPEVVAVARRRLDSLSHQSAAALGSGAPTEPDASTDSVDVEGTEPTDGPADDDHAAPAGESPDPSPRHVARPLPYDVRLLDRVRDLLPSSLRGSAGLGSHHVTVIALVGAAAIAAGAWLALRSTPQTLTVPTVGPVRPTIVSVGSGPATSVADGSGATAPGWDPSATLTSAPAVAANTAAPTIVVDVAGKVRRPGIVELANGARVVDAIDAAGGAQPRVDLSGLNLARPLVDGEQILVGVPTVSWPSAATSSVPLPTSAASPVALVNINTASESELESLPGIGPVTAAAILAWRTEHGGFTSVDELLEVSGIGDATLADLAPLVTV